MNNYSGDIALNVGTGKDISILNLAKMIKKIVGFEGDIVTDLSKPDGTPRKLLDISQLKNIGWNSTISLADGIASTYKELKQKNWY